jgi:hypothetical protein
MSDVMDDDGTGDAALGVISGRPYSIVYQSVANEAFMSAFRKANNSRGQTSWR